MGAKFRHIGRAGFLSWKYLFGRADYTKAGIILLSGRACFRQEWVIDHRLCLSDGYVWVPRANDDRGFCFSEDTIFVKIHDRPSRLSCPFIDPVTLGVKKLGMMALTSCQLR